MNVKALLIAGPLLAAAVFAGAGSMNDHDVEGLQQPVSEFLAQGQAGDSLRLADITDFDWDSVIGFSGTMPIRVYRRHFGEDYRVPDDVVSELTENSAVLVFVEEGRVARHFVLGPPVFLVGMDAEPHGHETALQIGAPKGSTLLMVE